MDLLPLESLTPLAMHTVPPASSLRWIEDNDYDCSSIDEDDDDAVFADQED